MVGGACVSSSPINKGGCASFGRFQISHRWKHFPDLIAQGRRRECAEGNWGCGEGEVDADLVLWAGPRRALPGGL